MEAREVDVLALLDELDELLSSAKSVPLSEQVRLERTEVFALLDRIRASLPDAVKEARRIVKQREELLVETRRECERLHAEAGEQASRETSEMAVYRMAERRADEILVDARRVTHEQQLSVDEWADRILATLDPNFERLLLAIRRGRDGLAERSSHESSIDSAPRISPAPIRTEPNTTVTSPRAARTNRERMDEMNQPAG